MNEELALKNFVKNYRIAHNQSQEDFAAGCGTSLGFVSQVERGIANPTLDMMKGMAAYMGTTVSAMLNTEHSEEEPK